MECVQMYGHDETYQVTQTLASSHTVVCAKDEKRFGASVIFEPSKTQQNNKGQAVKTQTVFPGNS